VNPQVRDKQKIQALSEEKEDNLRLVIDTIPTMAWSLLPDGAVDFVNQRWLEYAGLSLEEALADTTGIVNPEDLPKVMEKWLTDRAVGEQCEDEMRLRRADGEYRWFLVRTVPLRNEQGNIVKWYGTSTDIEDRKRAEDAILREKNFTKAALDSMPGLFYLIDDQGRFLRWNKNFEMVSGYSSDEVSRLVPADVFSQADKGIVTEKIKKVFLTGEATVEAEFVAKDRSKTPYFFTGKRVLIDGRPCLVGMGMDITGRKQADDRIRRLNRLYAVLSGINALIVRASSAEELFREACRIAVEPGGFGLAWIGALDRKTLQLQPVAWHGIGGEHAPRLELDVGADAPAGGTLAGQAIRDARAVISNDVERDPRILLKNEMLAKGLRSVIVLPLLVSGEVVGTLTLVAAEAGFFDEEEVKLLTDLAGDIAFAIDHIEKKEKLDYLVLYDQLTGLANRALFVERLNQTIHAAGQTEGKFALAMLDIERLRTINESLGRQAGDALLKLVAERLKIVGGPSGVSRLSADHFALIVDAVKERSQAGRIVNDALQRCFDESFRVSDTELRISAKTGVALYPGDGDDAETLLRNAEAALRKAKGLGERHVLYSSALNEGTAGQLTLENRLRQALEKDEFVLHYQPKVDVHTRRIVGVEALIRWQSPDLGLVPPMKFIPLMEQTGLILEVGAWALRRAAADHRSWVEQRLQAPRVAVNVSAIQLRQREFVGAVEQAISEGVAPTGIDLEITESLVMEDIEGNIQKLKEVRALGVGIAIDDFGTGYSSLGYLAKLPVHALKIDRSFIITLLNDSDAMTLVSTIISLAHSLKLRVVAEGVEEEQQATYLRLLRCDEMQGYLFSKPLPLEQMTALLEAKA
jgi:diguanylate cyclase (GGDEF)-like protein/PAS domain S-box-containing protein